MNKLIIKYDIPWKVRKNLNKNIKEIYKKIEIYDNKIILWNDREKKEINYFDYEKVEFAPATIQVPYARIIFGTPNTISSIKRVYDGKTFLGHIVFRSGLIFNLSANLFCNEIFEIIDENFRKNNDEQMKKRIEFVKEINSIRLKK